MRQGIGFEPAAHRRGQLATPIEQSGQDPGITDLPWMPGVVTIED